MVRDEENALTDEEISSVTDLGRFRRKREDEAQSIVLGNVMHFRKQKTLCSLLLVLLFGYGVQAQSIQFTVKEIALKSGESTEFGDVWYIDTSCKSLLKSTPEVEILDGPPGVTASINSAKVVPRGYSCANPVSGGKLIIAAKDITDYSYTRMTLRVRYKTSMGDRERSENINIALFPSN